MSADRALVFLRRLWASETVEDAGAVLTALADGNADDAIGGLGEDAEPVTKHTGSYAFIGGSIGPLGPRVDLQVLMISTKKDALGGAPMHVEM